MQTNFYATREDKIAILDFIFAATDYQIYDHYSDAGEELKRYFSTAEIVEKFDLEKGGQYAVCLGLWNPADGTKNIARRIELDPKRCDGHTFRYASTGWGVQQLYFGGIQNIHLSLSLFKGFNEKGALVSDLINPENERAAHLLDWKLIRSDQLKLKNYIEKKLGVEKHDGTIALPDACRRIRNDEIKLL